MNGLENQKLKILKLVIHTFAGLKVTVTVTFIFFKTIKMLILFSCDL